MHVSPHPATTHSCGTLARTWTGHPLEDGQLRWKRELAIKKNKNRPEQKPLRQRGALPKSQNQEDDPDSEIDQELTNAEVDSAKEVPLAPPHVPADILDKYEVYEWRHASAILKSDF